MRNRALVLILGLLAVARALRAQHDGAPVSLTPAQIVEKNISARGGLGAWRAIDSLIMTGKIAVGANRPQVSFALDVKRPRKARIEVQFNGETAVHIYDGQNAWKIMPFLDRYNVEPYPSEEMNDAPASLDLDGPLIDYEAKGTFIELDGMEKVDGRDAYRLRLTMKDGTVRRIWIDGQTFLEAKVEATPRRFNGNLHAVITFYRDYKLVQGLTIPHLFVTALDGVEQTEKVIVENVVINPKLDDKLFTKPE